MELLFPWWVVFCYRRHDDAQNPVSLCCDLLLELIKHETASSPPWIPPASLGLLSSSSAQTSGQIAVKSLLALGPFHPKLTVSKVQRPNKSWAAFLVVKGTRCYNLVFFLSSPQTIRPQITSLIWQPLNLFHFVFNPLDQIYLKQPQYWLLSVHYMQLTQYHWCKWTTEMLQNVKIALVLGDYFISEIRRVNIDPSQ